MQKQRNTNNHCEYNNNSFKNSNQEALIKIKSEYDDININIKDKVFLQIENLELQNSENLKQKNSNLASAANNNLLIIKQTTTKQTINNKNDSIKTTGVVKYNNNYSENEFAIGQLNKNDCTPDSVVKIRKSQPFDKLSPQAIGNSSQVELFNQQLANMQKDIMVNNIKQNKLSLGTKIMMENERVHAQQAIETGIYVTWCSKDVCL